MTNDEHHAPDVHGVQVFPQRWADLLLRASLPAHDVECVSGDILEEYRYRAADGSPKWRADVWFIRHTACTLGPRY